MNLFVLDKLNISNGLSSKKFTFEAIDLFLNNALHCAFATFAK
jgi:hypothetical protein